MHFYYAFLAIDFAFGIHGLVPGQQLINIFLCFLKSSWNRNFVGNRRLFWGASEFPKAPAKGFFPKNCCQFQLVTSCKGASVQRLLCVKAFVCKSLCVKTTLCKDFFV